jgi:hypothetical protein
LACALSLAAPRAARADGALLKCYQPSSCMQQLSIGADIDRRTHVGLGLPKGMVRVSVQVRVDKVSPKGINFFALQTNFPGNVWAHGGLQDDTAADHVSRNFQVNWCGLVSRGGGSKDYKEADPAHDLDLIQCPDNAPYDWHPGVTYQYVVERGRRVTFPPGEYGVTPKHNKKYQIDHPRSMWEWKLTIHPLSAKGPDYQAVLYTQADTINSAMIWHESGYGSTDAELRSTWSHFTYRTAQDPRTDVPAKSWGRF